MEKNSDVKKNSAEHISVRKKYHAKKNLAVDMWQLAYGSWQVAVGRWQWAGGSWHVAQLSGGCEKVRHYVRPAGNGGKKRDIAGGAAGVL